MRGQRPHRDRWTASFRTAGARVCLSVGLLAAAAAGPAAALDAGDGTLIAPQPGRRPLSFESGKVLRLDGAFQRRYADKAELSAYQDFAMHFGSLRRASGSVVLGTDDAIIADPDLLVFGGTASSAVIRLEGDPLRSVSIEVASTPAGGFDLEAFDTSLGAPPLAGQPLDGSGNLVFLVGATLTLDADAIAIGEDQQIAYTITASYE